MTSTPITIITEGDLDTEFDLRYAIVAGINRCRDYAHLDREAGFEGPNRHDLDAIRTQQVYDRTEWVYDRTDWTGSRTTSRAL